MLYFDSFLFARKILSENKLEQETLDAQAAEFERQKRLQELKKQQLAALLATESEPKKEKDSQLKSLLQGFLFLLSIFKLEPFNKCIERQKDDVLARKLCMESDKETGYCCAVTD